MSTSPSSRIAKIAFWLWVVGGVVWVGLSGEYADRYEAHPDHTFRYVHPTPELEARALECDRLEWMTNFFRYWSIAYASVGLIVFRRRGCSAACIALAIIVMSWFVQLAAGLGHL